MYELLNLLLSLEEMTAAEVNALSSPFPALPPSYSCTFIFPFLFHPCLFPQIPSSISSFPAPLPSLPPTLPQVDVFHSSLKLLVVDCLTLFLSPHLGGRQFTGIHTPSHLTRPHLSCPYRSCPYVSCCNHSQATSRRKCNCCGGACNFHAHCTCTRHHTLTSIYTLSPQYTHNVVADFGSRPYGVKPALGPSWSNVPHSRLTLSPPHTSHPHTAHTHTAVLSKSQHQVLYILFHSNFFAVPP